MFKGGNAVTREIGMQSTFSYANQQDLNKQLKLMCILKLK